MSVYIKGMEMPKSCGDCPIGDSLCCGLMPGAPALWREYTNAVRENRRHKDCPLVPVPPHGDLIDRDALIATENQHYALIEDDWYVTVRKVELMPAIIPASKEGE